MKQIAALTAAIDLSGRPVFSWDPAAAVGRTRSAWPSVLGL